MSNDKAEKKTELVAVRVSPSLKSKLDAIAQKDRRTLSWVVNRILEKYLNTARKAKL